MRDGAAVNKRAAAHGEPSERGCVGRWRECCEVIIRTLPRDMWALGCAVNERGAILHFIVLAGGGGYWI